MRFLLIFLTLFTFSFALPFDKIDSEMTKRIDNTIALLQNSKDKEAISKEIFALFDEIFDYPLMAKLSLSKEYKKLSQEEQLQFNQVFEENLKKSFTSKLSLYKDEKMLVLGGDLIKENRYNLKTSLIYDGKENYIIFKFHKLNNDWKIYDVDILGISVIQTYRSQFLDILKQNNFQTLIQKLQNEITFDSKQK
ncbi:toluene tolerance protein [Helicobacter valdiviensis]|uniref:Toluene tolerance protein n=1 Tax=Helicobacter valdiviensis TaxID=1458358 RepID=A0A2W6MU30_9HELI|nr:ABC transporter substrate-binding protein [Helicobacter valdiviensis]PZT47471.1 toluene tolerance protein [Helicobacter valdiviensis]